MSLHKGNLRRAGSIQASVNPANQARVAQLLAAVEENAAAFASVGEALGRSLETFEQAGGLSCTVDDETGKPFATMREFVERGLLLNGGIWED
jgi:hypothetical protein